MFPVFDDQNMPSAGFTIMSADFMFMIYGTLSRRREHHAHRL